MAEPGKAQGRIFISYRRQETAYPAGWLYDRLAGRLGEGQIFKDVDSIHPGDDFVEVITAAVAECDVLLALIGDRWLTITGEDGKPRIEDPEDFVRLEIEAALARDVLVIPVLVDGAEMPHADELPPSLAPLAHRQALELSPAHFNVDLSRLLTALDETLSEAENDGRTAPAKRRYRPSRRTLAMSAIAGVLVLVLVPLLTVLLSRGSDGEAPAANFENVVFQDDFSSTSSGWDDANGVRNGGHYTNGTYRLVGEWTQDVWSESSYPRNAAAVFPNAPEEVLVSVVGRRLRGKRDGAYGIVCRADPGLQRYYQFAIWPGSAVIEKIVPVGATYYQLASGDPSAVHPNGTNRLAATCVTDEAGNVRLEFQVNGRTVASAVDTGAQLAPPLLTGSVGLIIAKGSEGADPVEAEFDDFVVAGA
jgi:hypothetical protein